MIFLSIFLQQRFKLTPLSVAPYSMLSFQAITWLMPGTTRNLSWRLALTFLMLVLTCALTPDLYLALVIVIYLLLSAVCLLTLFFESELGARNLSQNDSRFPKGLLAQATGIAFVVLCLSLILFPILPRMSEFSESRVIQALPGYSEQVGLGGSQGFSRASNREVILKIILPRDSQGLDTSNLFPNNLLRTRVLNQFNGSKWQGVSLVQNSQTVNARKTNEKTITFEREKLNTQLLPVPYGTQNVFVDQSVSSEHLKKTNAFEYFHLDAFETSIRYQVELTNSINHQSESIGDSEYSKIFEKLNENTKQKIIELSQKIFQTSESALSPETAISNYFNQNGFTSTMNQGSDPTLEQFLFHTKRGHCEQFANATAFLLLAKAIPARMISGFKISRPAKAGMIIVRQEDAHAWVEYYHKPTQKWIPLDLTPPSNDRGIQDLFFRELRDTLDTYWLKYVVTFSSTSELGFTQKATKNKPLNFFRTTVLKDQDILFYSGLILAIVLSIFLSVLAFKTKSKVGQIHIPLESKEKISLLKQFKKHPSILISLEYAELRFGPLPVTSKEWKQKFTELKKRLRTSL